VLSHSTSFGHAQRSQKKLQNGFFIPKPLVRAMNGAFNDAWFILKEEKNMDDKKKKLIQCLKEKGGACSLEECCKACDMSKNECKKMINSMDNVKIHKHGDVVLMDGL